MDNNSSYINKVRWFILPISGNLIEELGKSDDSRITMRHGIECIDRSHKSIGPKDLYEIPADLKDRIVRVRADVGYGFVLFRAVGEAQPMVFYEWPAGRRAWPAPHRRRLKKGQMFLGTHLEMSARAPQIKRFGRF